jgi:hypothetical protein
MTGKAYLLADDIREDAVTRFGAYILLSRSVLPERQKILADRMTELGLTNEYDAPAGHPLHAFAILKREAVFPGKSRDPAVAGADWIVHAASPDAGIVKAFTSELSRVLGAEPILRILAGVARPTRYTTNLIHNYAYGSQVLQQPGPVMPVCFFHPMRKNLSWWKKDWLARHTYFLPRYDEHGKILSDGHIRAAEAGISFLMRRTYRHSCEPAPEAEYDFLNYFECAEEDMPAFRDVLEALRDTRRNPEWAFVSEGPLWQGRRLDDWPTL